MSLLKVLSKNVPMFHLMDYDATLNFNNVILKPVYQTVIFQIFNSLNYPITQPNSLFPHKQLLKRKRTALNPFYYYIPTEQQFNDAVWIVPDFIGVDMKSPFFIFGEIIVVMWPLLRPDATIVFDEGENCG